MSGDYVSAAQAAKILGVTVQKITRTRKRLDKPENLLDYDGNYNLDELRELISKSTPSANKKAEKKRGRKPNPMSRQRMMNPLRKRSTLT